MNNNDIRWKAFPRDVLPEALFGASRVSHTGRLGFERYDLLGDNVVAGFAEARSRNEYNPPCIFVIGDESAAETLSWLRVYAPEASPLSQFGRVVSSKDWEQFGKLDQTYRSEVREDKWASIIVGESLAQGDSDVELRALPLSRAASCFSTAVARAVSVHGADEATRTCTDRLRLIEADRRFARRLVSVNDLVPIWSLAGVSLAEPLSPQDAVSFVLEAAEKYLPDVSLRGREHSLSNLRGYPELLSDSIEERVVSFQRLANELVHASERGPRSGLSASSLAAAAFLVGRSTSHEFLLRRIGKAFPAAPVWFGLIAALAGAEAWDPDWTHATKSIERQVRARFDWADAAGFDLCWTEFAWLAGTFEGPEIFLSLPKLVPRAVSVEILPGATCQFRLAAGGSSDAESRAPSIASDRERELHAALSQFIGLATRMRPVLEGQPAPIQQSLDLGSGGTTTKVSKTKKFRSPTSKP